MWRATSHHNQHQQQQHMLNNQHYYICSTINKDHQSTRMDQQSTLFFSLFQFYSLRFVPLH